VSVGRCWSVAFDHFLLYPEGYMARIRSIKPEFFIDEDLQDLEAAQPGAYCMLVFAGLWGHCSKDGVFEWKPRTLKLHILPFLPFEMADTLAILESAGFVRRFVCDDREYGYIPTFETHQRISGKEAQQSPKYPLPDQGVTGEAPGKHPGSTGEVTEKLPGAQERKGKERNKERISSSLSLVKVLTDREPLQPASREMMTLDAFRGCFLKSTGKHLPGGCNDQAVKLCARFPVSALELAFCRMAEFGGKTMGYLEEVLEGKPMARASPAERLSFTEIRHEKTMQAAREFAEEL